MEPLGTMKTKRMTVETAVPSFGSIVSIPYAVGTIPDPANWECESAEEVIELCEAIVSITETHESVDYEWNGADGWEYISDDEDVIAEWCEIWKGCAAKDNEEVQAIFREAVLREYMTRPKVFSAYSIDDLVEYWIGKYNVGDGHFILSDLTVVPEEVRVKTESEEEE